MHIPIIMLEKTASYGLWIMFYVFSPLYSYCQCYEVFMYYLQKPFFSQSKKQNFFVLEIYIYGARNVVLIWKRPHVNMTQYTFTSILEIGQWFFHNPVSSCAPSSHNIRISLMGRHISIAKGNVLIYRDELLSPFRILTSHTSFAK